MSTDAGRQSDHALAESSARGSLLARTAGRVPRAAVACMVIGILHSVGWALITPAFQGADEIVQYGYVDAVSQTGRPPDASAFVALPNPEALTALEGIPWSVVARPNWSTARSDELDRAMRRAPDDFRPGGAGYQSSNPPLYGYLLAPADVIVRAVGGNVLDRLLVMRLGTALLMAVIVGAAFGFVREILPRHPSAAVVGGLAVALQPMLGFVAGSVNNDVPVYAFGALLLWAAARTFRLGPSRTRLTAAGAAVLGALLSKVSGIGVAFATMPLLLGVLAATPRLARLRALRWSAPVLVGVGLVWFVVRQVHQVRPIDVEGNAVGEVLRVDSTPSYYPLEALSYVWQFYLPRLGFMTDIPAGSPLYPVWNTYLEAFTGRFGWFQYGFGGYANTLYAVLLGAAIVLAIVAVARRPGRLRGRRFEAVAYVASFALFMLFVNLAGYKYFKDTGQGFEQVRYLLPFIALYAGLVGLAVVGIGKRWAPLLGGFVAVGGAIHVLSAFLLTLERYYT